MPSAFQAVLERIGNAGFQPVHEPAFPKLKTKSSIQSYLATGLGGLHSGQLKGLVLQLMSADAHNAFPARESLRLRSVSWFRASFDSFLCMEILLMSD
jgi:hypothetical protein